MKKLFFFTLSLAAVFACQKKEAPVAEMTGSEVRFKAEIPNNYVLKSTALEGKKVRISADATLEYATTVAEAVGTTLTPEAPIYWKAGQTEKTTFVGLYQELESGDAPAAPANLQLEYNMVSGDVHDYAYHSTFMTARAVDVTPETTATLAFSHPFSKLSVTVTNNLTDGFTVKNVCLKEIVTEGTLDLAAGTVTLGTAKAQVPATLADGKYCAIVLPQTAKMAIYVVVGKENETDREYAFTLTAASAFAANKAYSATVTINDATVAGEPVGFAFTVADWEDAGSLETEVLVETHVWSVIGLGGDWETDLDMTETSAGVWEADITYADSDEFKLRLDHAWDTNAGLKEGWTYYGLGEFDDGYLAQNSSTNITLEAAGTYHLVFNSTNYRFIVTIAEP